jgi:uncharacterized protein YacL
MQQALLIFVAIPVVYSVGFFIWCYLAEKKPIFSKRNSRSMVSVMYGHITVLLILTMLAQMASRFYPSLPSWLTDRPFQVYAHRPSYFVVLCTVIVLAIGAAETRWIYIDRGSDEPESNDSPA